MIINKNQQLYRKAASFNTIAINVKYIDREEDNTYSLKFTILTDPSLVIITIYIVCLINAWESREKVF